MKKFFRFFIILVSVVIIVTAASCNGNGTPKRATPINHAGSAIFVGNVNDMPYTIPDLEVESDKNYFFLDEYVYDVNGIPYNIYNSKNNLVGQIRLSKKSDYEGDTISVNIDSYSQSVYYVDSTILELELYSTGTIKKELSIIILPRETTLRIILDNVHLYTRTSTPVIYNLSDTDIDVVCKGNSSIKSGCEHFSDDEKDAYYEIMGYAGDIISEQLEEISVLDVRAALNYVIKLKKSAMTSSTSIAFMVATYVVDKYAGRTNNNGISGGYTEFAIKFMDKISMSIVEAMSGVKDKIYASSGAAGSDGVSAIITPAGISFSGDGHLTVTGGNGFQGGDASGFIGRASGGRGGNGGNGIECHTVINLISGNCNFNGGKGGDGGNGNQYFDYQRINGAKGSKGKDISAIHICEKR
ncbi:MAG: hypothetical protein J6N93_04440 [Clostridia bacterium]|nr:hypothetical protein [Clostridia bacterium]